jgi:hypothetical protein
MSRNDQWPRAVRIAIWIAVGFSVWGVIAALGWLIARAA